jgi:hypothetical protein
MGSGTEFGLELKLMRKMRIFVGFGGGGGVFEVKCLVRVARRK